MARVMLKSVRNGIKAIPLLYVTFKYIASPYKIEGKSMEPSLCHNDIILCNKMANVFQDYQVNDIVVLKSPSNPSEYLVKRVRGMEYDIIMNKNEIVKIPSGHCWLEGDNARASWDSRTYGPFPIGLLVGKVSKNLFNLGL